MTFSMDELVERFRAWFREAAEHPAITEPTAMTLATVDADGSPSARVVLLKECDARGFAFYTNFQSRKGQALLSNHKAALCFYWMPLAKQIRVEGLVEEVTREEADAYFASRSRDSQLGAWASQQSAVLESREALMEAHARMRAQYEGKDVPRPPHWSGFRVIPSRIEFWQEQPYRLHDREVFIRAGDDWRMERLNP